jgi:hypothetical protein
MHETKCALLPPSTTDKKVCASDVCVNKVSKKENSCVVAKAVSKAKGVVTFRVLRGPRCGGGADIKCGKKEYSERTPISGYSKKVRLRYASISIAQAATCARGSSKETAHIQDTLLCLGFFF